MEEIKIVKQYATWTVNETEYKLKLTTSEICRLEEKLGGNLMNILMNGVIPSLSAMLTITHGAMQAFNHGVKLDDVKKMFDAYCDEGGSQVDFMTDVLMPTFQVSGFFSKEQAETMEQKLAEAKELL